MGFLIKKNLETIKSCKNIAKLKNKHKICGYILYIMTKF